jgi:hypothetical protein
MFHSLIIKRVKYFTVVCQMSNVTNTSFALSSISHQIGLRQFMQLQCWKKHYHLMLPVPFVTEYLFSYDTEEM